MIPKQIGRDGVIGKKSWRVGVIAKKIATRGRDQREERDGVIAYQQYIIFLASN